jgi:hypothetical protein
MRTKTRLNVLLTILLACTVLSISSVYAVTYQGAYATLVFGVGALNEVTVYQLAVSKGAMTTPGLALTNIEFNSTTGIALWVNATVAASTSQLPATPIIYVDNTGTTNAALNISTTDDIHTTDATLYLRYIYNQSEGGVFGNYNTNPTSPAGGSSGGYLNATQIQLDSSFTPTEQNWGIWLYGNFSGSTQGQDLTTFWVNATFA